jgi:hypothetical protein
MKTEQPKMQRATPPIAALSLAAAAISLSPAHAGGSSGPDILGVRTGMSPEQVYEALRNIDVTHRVTVGQVPIPALLGNKTAVYAMAPESRNSGGEENMSVWISLPPMLSKCGVCSVNSMARSTRRWKKSWTRCAKNMVRRRSRR